MIFAEYFRLSSEKEKTEAVARLVKVSTGDFDFYLFTVLGILMTAFGLVLDTFEVIIGGMLIVPVLYPILSLSLGIVLSDFTLMFRSIRTLIFSFSASILIAFMMALILGRYYDFGLSEQIVSRAHPSLLFFLVACISGLVASYALVNPNLNEAFLGVAISVSLVSPLAVVGIGLGSFDLKVAGGAFVLFLLNFLGIALASMVTFTMTDLYGTHKTALSAVRQEEQRLKNESEKIQEIQNNHTNE
jgi:uncharacterized hydrophobic protein (TIGR00271 family)